jgi:hypothetical protein
MGSAGLHGASGRRCLSERHAGVLKGGSSCSKERLGIREIASMFRSAARGVASLILLTGLSAGAAQALDIGPRTVPVKIFGIVLPIPLTASLDMHTDADHVALDLTATGNLAALQAHALEIARRLPLPEDACKHKGVNLVINSIDDAHIGAQGEVAVIDMSGHATAWACAKVLGAKVKTKIVSDTVAITLPVELYTRTPRQVGLRVKGQVTIRTGNPDTQEAAAAMLGDLNGRLTVAVEKALDSEKAQAMVPDIPGLDVSIDHAAFAEDHGDLEVKTHVHGRATSEAVNGLMEMMNKKAGE